MMTQPPLDELLKKVGNRFLLVGLAAKRARQLLDGAQERVDIDSDKQVTLALEEIYEGKLAYEAGKTSSAQVASPRAAAAAEPKTQAESETRTGTVETQTGDTGADADTI